MTTGQTIALTIDGKHITVPEGGTVLDAARAADIYVPTLCYDQDLSPYGACRMCVVEIESMRGLPTACTTPAQDGMVVHTDTRKVNDVRRTICEMLIADHPADCLSCASNQKCELQKIAAYLGVRQQRMSRTQRESVIDDSNPFFIRDLTKCVLCGRCVRACHEIRGVGAIDIAGRGLESRVAAFADDLLTDSVCESCGECVARCPVGALRVKDAGVPATSEVRTVCPYCGCGCGLILGIRGGRIVSVEGDRDNPISRGSLCVKGRFGLDYVQAEDRLTRPLVRRNGKLEETDWNDALSVVSARMREIRTKHGPGAVAGLSSAKCTNEENYIFQKFMRAVIGTNSVDHCARL